jgi:hypothetical protein
VICFAARALTRFCSRPSSRAAQMNEAITIATPTAETTVRMIPRAVMLLVFPLEKTRKPAARRGPALDATSVYRQALMTLCVFRPTGTAKLRASLARRLR